MEEIAPSAIPLCTEKKFHIKEKNVSELLEKRIRSHSALWKSFEGVVKPSMQCNSKSYFQSKALVESQVISKNKSNTQNDPPNQTTPDPSSPYSVVTKTEKFKKSDEFTLIPFVEKDWENDSNRNQNSLWEESDEGTKNYDAWQVMKDEHAKDSGFYYVGEMTGEARFADTGTDFFFRILGTSADDINSQPHVLSPPLMESLLSFVPDQLTEENLWLKFSMVRDGSSLETLQDACKYCQHSFLAVETIEGDVFGSFTTKGWTKHSGFYGNGEAFLWKMRYNRLTPCYSLIEQAKLESDVDVYPYSGRNEYVQLCTDKLIALGGGNPDLKSYIDTHGTLSVTHGHDFGFGIAIDENLAYGSTSLCETFNNPPLLSHSSEQLFKVLNLEIWAFTPCSTVKEAEHMEMAKAIRTEAFHETKEGISAFLGSNTNLKRCEVEMEHIIIPGG